MSYTPNQEKLRLDTNGGLITAGGLVAGNLIAIKQFDSGTNATYTPTEGTRLIYVELVGGGGGSAGSPATSSTQCVASGSGGGASSIVFLLKIELNTTATYSIGSGGSAGFGNQSGLNGGTTSFTMQGLTWSADGGWGGSVGSVSTTSSFGSGGQGGVNPELPIPNSNVLYQKANKGQFAGYSIGTFNVGGTFKTSNPGFPGDAYCVNCSYETTAASGGTDIAYFGITTSGGFYKAKEGTTPGGGGRGSVNLGSGANAGGSSGKIGRIMIWEYA